MLATAVALVLYASAAFIDGETRLAIFDTREVCEQAVARARTSGLFVTDCVRVEFPKPRNGKPA